MWRTPLGERTLLGAESALVLELVGYVYDQIDVIHAGTSYGVGVGPFDRLQGPQQLMVLHEVGSALLSRDVSPPKLTAIREATVAVLFKELRINVEVEIDCHGCQDESCPSWRRLLFEALLETGADPQDVPDAECCDLNEWVPLIDSAAERILWDSDWEMEEIFSDGDPEKIDSLKQIMRITEDYFATVPADPAGADLEILRCNLNQLTGTSH